MVTAARRDRPGGTGGSAMTKIRNLAYGLVAVGLIWPWLNPRKATLREVDRASSMIRAELGKAVAQGKLLEAHMADCKRCQRNRRCEMRQAMVMSFRGGS